MEVFKWFANAFIGHKFCAGSASAATSGDGLRLSGGDEGCAGDFVQVLAEVFAFLSSDLSGLQVRLVHEQVGLIQISHSR